MKAKLQRFFGYFKVSTLKQEVLELGAVITFKNLMFITLLIMFSAFLAGFLLRLDWAYCAILALFFFLCMPSMVITKFKADHERRRFSDTVNYMEQLIYSFHKANKIREALVDVYEVSSGNVKETIRKMLHCIDYDMTTSKLYHKAFDIMHDEYNCTRMQVLHSYLIEIEENGGKSDRSLNMLLTDIRNWASRVLVYQQERRNIKSKITLSIFLAMTSCGIMVNLIPDEYIEYIVSEPLYQIGTLFILLCCIALYVVASNKIAVSFLDLETDGEVSAYAIKCMKYLQEFRRKNHLKPAIIKFCLFLPLVIFCLYRKLYWLTVPVVLLMMMFMLHSYVKRNDAVKRVLRELNKMFPTWIRSLVLLLQTENVHMAVKKSVRLAPEILVPEINQFLINLDKDPNSMRPYNEFLKEFEVPQLKMSIHYLYSIAQFGTQDMLAQLDYLIEQNAQLALAEEQIRNEDALAGFSVMTLMPMLFAVMKLIIDLVLFLSYFTGYMSSFGNVQL